jgi:hypothetical protein
MLAWVQHICMPCPSPKKRMILIAYWSSNLLVCADFLNAYSSCGRLNDAPARQVRAITEQWPNAISWSMCTQVLGAFFDLASIALAKKRMNC